MADFYQQAQTPGKAKEEENKDASVPVTLRKSKEKIAEFQVVVKDGVYLIDTHRLHESEVKFMKEADDKKKEADAKKKQEADDEKQEADDEKRKADDEKRKADAKERRKKRTAPPQTLRRSQRCIRLK